MSNETLKLTGIIRRGDSPGVFVGCIKEIAGIIVQGPSVDAVYQDLIESTRGMLDYKRDEALALLAEQLHSKSKIKTNASLDFKLAKEVERELA